MNYKKFLLTWLTTWLFLLMLLTLWTSLEMIFYWRVEPRIVDDIITIPITMSIYFNVKSIINKIL